MFHTHLCFTQELACALIYSRLLRWIKRGLESKDYQHFLAGSYSNTFKFLILALELFQFNSNMRKKIAFKSRRLKSITIKVKQFKC